MTLPQMTTMTITPEIATQILESMGPNRNLNRRRVLTMAEAMTWGQWKDPGNPLRFHKGKLVDGQHRLSALVEAGVTLTFLCIEVVDEDALNNIDTGMKRTSGHALSIHGIRNSALLSSVATIIDSYVNGKSIRTAVDTDRCIRAALGNVTILEDTVSDYGSGRTRLFFSPSSVVAMAVLAEQSDVHKASVFMYKLITGTNLTSTDPAYKLRERLIAIKARKSGGNARSDAFLLCIKAWNAHYNGKTISTLKIVDNEKMPAFAGLPTNFADEWNARALLT